MKQLYALIDESKFNLHRSDFSGAVKIGGCRLGVFVDIDRERYENLDSLTILTYDQAVEFSSKHKEKTPL